MADEKLVVHKPNVLRDLRDVLIGTMRIIDSGQATNGLRLKLAPGRVTCYISDAHKIITRGKPILEQAVFMGASGEVHGGHIRASLFATKIGKNKAYFDNNKFDISRSNIDGSVVVGQQQGVVLNGCEVTGSALQLAAVHGGAPVVGMIDSRVKNSELVFDGLGGDFLRDWEISDSSVSVSFKATLGIRLIAVDCAISATDQTIDFSNATGTIVVACREVDSAKALLRLFEEQNPGKKGQARLVRK